MIQTNKIIHKKSSFKHHEIKRQETQVSTDTRRVRRSSSLPQVARPGTEHRQRGVSVAPKHSLHNTFDSTAKSTAFGFFFGDFLLITFGGKLQYECYERKNLIRVRLVNVYVLSSKCLWTPAIHWLNKTSTVTEYQPSMNFYAIFSNKIFAFKDNHKYFLHRKICLVYEGKHTIATL